MDTAYMVLYYCPKQFTKKWPNLADITLCQSLRELFLTTYKRTRNQIPQRCVILCVFNNVCSQKVVREDSETFAIC